jgi:hypothetical protein
VAASSGRHWSDRFERAGPAVIICAIKLTHDAGVALVGGGRLVFSVGLEKLANNPRHHDIDDFELVGELLRGHCGCRGSRCGWGGSSAAFATPSCTSDVAVAPP